MTESDFQSMARDIRLTSMEMISRAGASHVGSVFSCAEILAVLYCSVLRFDRAEPEWEERDRFVMSKGHAAAGLYAVQALVGLMPTDKLLGFGKDGDTLHAHVAHRGNPTIDFSTGSLGHGMPIAVGLALGLKRSGRDCRVYTLLSDGECDEGTIWESALIAPALKLGNLTAIIDYNKIQSMGRVDSIVPLEPLAEKWRAFGWHVTEVDGHDVMSLSDALPLEEPGVPHCVIAHTVKGKGVSFMEDTVLWHYRCPVGDELASAISELKGEVVE